MEASEKPQLPIDEASGDSARRRPRARRPAGDRAPDRHRRARRAGRARAGRGGPGSRPDRRRTRSRSAPGCSTARMRRRRSTTCGGVRGRGPGCARAAIGAVPWRGGRDRATVRARLLRGGGRARPHIRADSRRVWPSRSPSTSGRIARPPCSTRSRSRSPSWSRSVSRRWFAILPRKTPPTRSPT